MSKVFFSPANNNTNYSAIEARLSALFRAGDFNSIFERGDLAALKLHVGEPGRNTCTSPDIVKAVVKLMSAAGAKPFLTDTSVLYKSQRDNGIGHFIVAQNRGFGFNKIGAPFLPADGLVGTDEREIEIEGGRHYKKVSIASAVIHARSMLVLSHATGHVGTGYGGALKNLGMGCSTKKAKLSQHFGQAPRIKEAKCIACGECEKWCPADAVSLDNTAVIDTTKCIGCGECIAVCLYGAVSFDWSVMGQELQERIVEHAAAVARSKAGRICYVTVAENITKDCDCMSSKQDPVVEDVGIFASRDPVAIDRAVVDAVKAKAGKTIESLSYPSTDSNIQMDYAQSMGLGTVCYELIAV